MTYLLFINWEYMCYDLLNGYIYILLWDISGWIQVGSIWVKWVSSRTANVMNIYNVHCHATLCVASCWGYIGWNNELLLKCNIEAKILRLSFVLLQDLLEITTSCNINTTYNCTWLSARQPFYPVVELLKPIIQGKLHALILIV